MKYLARVLLPLCLAAGCEGGPISDWPKSRSDRGNDGFAGVGGATGTNGGGGAENGAGGGTGATGGSTGNNTGLGATAGTTSGTGNGGGVTGGTIGFAGTGSPPNTEDGGGSIGGSPGADGGESYADAGGGFDAAAGDAGVALPDGDTPDGDIPDGGMPDGASCPATADGGSQGGCYGLACGSDLAALTERVEGTGECASPSDLELVCQGEIARVTAQCGEDHILSPWFARAVRDCVDDAPSLEGASAGCLGCYVDELTCVLTNCLVECLDASSDWCGKCRSDHCAEAFSRCSGVWGL